MLKNAASGSPTGQEVAAGEGVFAQLSGLMNPKSVAVVGASNRSDGWSGMAVPVLRRLGFAGRIFPVNPKYEELNDLKCYPSVSAIPEPVDAVLIFVPQKLLPEILEDCGSKGVRGAVILASGFSETGEEGRAMEETLREIANRNRIAICGPNCLGLANLDSGFMGLTAATFPEDMSAGRTALISQSGQLLMVLLARAHDQGVRMRYLVSTGNELNVEAADYASWALDDPEIASVCMNLEGLRTPSRFMALAEKAQAVEKPLIVLKLGRSKRAARTALAHTGKMAGAFRTYEAVFRQNNVVSVDDPMELAEAAALFEKCPPPRGERIAVVTFSGGWSGVMADQCEALDLPMADFTEKTVDGLRPLLDFTPPVNPLDLSGNVNNHPERWGQSLKIALDDENTDILVVFIHQVRKSWRGRLIGPVLELSETADKPIIVVYDGGKVVEAGYEQLARDGRLPIYRGSQQMLKALKRFTDYHKRAKRPVDDGMGPQIPADAGARVDALLAGGGRTMAEDVAKQALLAYGLPMVGETLVGSEADALRAAEAIGYPVVLKGLADGMEHKSDAGLVHLKLGDGDAVCRAYADLAEKLAGHTLNGKPAPCLVQKMVDGGVEAILGMQNDPDFGPMILVGVGGVMTELLNDVALRRAPLSRTDVAEMIDETRLGRLLAGYRGSPVADRAALEDAVLRLSALSVAHQDAIESIDINPVLVLPEGEGCVAVDALIIKPEDEA
ncbi:acetate--CoA ligase family protein [Martelella lutilitoris]|uniref:Acetate--CoA ligase family protein n=1 Tax=Martelella lutilitoris TaxID=2583532 RepID=A0A5C4JVD1_9HYPH|nr:acetate--CoA ligase family protein [Martelella lutilitoris]TNB49393.1 acetate--CoA ligase family protein [Martelella lutilitoris]